MIEWLERSLLYCPTHDNGYPLTDFGPGAEDVWFGEGGRLHGVFVPGPGPITVLFFHGNGGNLSHRAPLGPLVREQLGANLLIVDYQGYGKSAGSPSERATAADARAALAYLHSRTEVDRSKIIYYGESLGGAVAIDLAREAPPYALVAQSTFTSISDMTRLHYPMLRLLLPLTRNRYESLHKIAAVHAPVLFAHGARDELVPAESSERLFEAANEPKRLVILPGAAHNDVLDDGGPAIWKALRELLAI